MVLESLALLIFASLIGYAIVTHMRRDVDLASLLTVPALGFAVIVGAAFAASYLGFAMRDAAMPMGFVLLAGSVVSIAMRRTIPSRRDLIVFAATIAAVYALVGWPLFIYGGWWLGYVNGDMTFYIDSATDLYFHPLFSVPSSATLETNTDIFRHNAVNYAYAGARGGVEILLAWSRGMTGILVDRLYMATSIAVHAALVCSAGALISGTLRNRVGALCAATIAPMLAYGTYNGLLPQQLGLTLWSACAYWAVRSVDGKVAWRNAVPAAVLLAGGALVYPELFPFTAIAVVIFAVVARRGLQVAAGAVALAVVLLNVYAPTIAWFSYHQLAGGASAKSIGFIVPQVLQPIGVANAFGLLPLATDRGDIYTQVAILLGFALLVWLIVRLVRGLRSVGVAGAFAAVVVAVTVVLIVRRSDFGAFKAIFYAQPFIAASLGASAFTGRAGAAIALALAACIVPVQQYYALRSVAPISADGRYIAVPGATTRHLTSALDHLAGSGSIVSSMNPVQFDDLLVIHAPRRSTTSVARPSIRFPTPINPWERHLVDADGWWTTADKYEYSIQEDPRTKQLFYQLVKVPVGGTAATVRVGFVQARAASAADATLVDSPSLSVLNGDEGHDDIVSSRPLRKLHNHLVFLRSSRGAQGDSPDVPVAARTFYPAQGDPMHDGRTMQGLGRYLTFMVLRPSQALRLRLEFDSTLIGDGRNRLPRAKVTGRETVSPLLVGRGAARVLTPALRPFRTYGVDFVSIDMGDYGQPPPDPRSGLWMLYGSDVPYDTRMIVSYARDISAIDAQRPTPPAPQSVRLPAELQNVDLQFSGIYDDGWIAEQSYVILRKSGATTMIRADLQIPGRPGGELPGRYVLKVDGRTLASDEPREGDVSIVASAENLSNGPHRVQLEFERAYRLGPRDKRPASALLQYVAFTAG